MRRFDLIIFDCDGVLVDSERISNEVFARILKEECGLSLSIDGMFQTFVGNSMAECMRKIKIMMGTEPLHGLEARCGESMNLALKSFVTPVKGIERALSNIFYDMACLLEEIEKFAAVL